MQISVCRPYSVEHPVDMAKTLIDRTRPHDGRTGGAQTVVGQSPAMRRVMEQIQQVAATDSTVLLLGETGTGKELLATQVHQDSARRGRGMVRVNCAAIPATLIESELFGREKGAFTGALARQIGRFELADHSTLFLDEIGDLPPDVQIKLLRVLEEREIERLGSPRTIRVDARIVAGDAPQPRAADRGRHVPRGPVLPPQRVSGGRAAAARPRRGRPAARMAVHRRSGQDARAPHRIDRREQPGRDAALLVARERPRAPQRGRARDDRRHRAAPGDSGAAARRRVAGAKRAG